jgi:hypothetical protein
VIVSLRCYQEAVSVRCGTHEFIYPDTTGLRWLRLEALMGRLEKCLKLVGLALHSLAEFHSHHDVEVFLYSALPKLWKNEY